MSLNKSNSINSTNGIMSGLFLKNNLNYFTIGGKAFINQQNVSKITVPQMSTNNSYDLNRSQMQIPEANKYGGLSMHGLFPNLPKQGQQQRDPLSQFHLMPNGGSKGPMLTSQLESNMSGQRSQISQPKQKDISSVFSSNDVQQGSGQITSPIDHKLTSTLQQNQKSHITSQVLKWTKSGKYTAQNNGSSQRNQILNETKQLDIMSIKTMENGPVQFDNTFQDSTYFDKFFGEPNLQEDGSNPNEQKASSQLQKSIANAFMFQKGKLAAPFIGFWCNLLNPDLAFAEGFPKSAEIGQQNILDDSFFYGMTGMTADDFYKDLKSIDWGRELPPAILLAALALPAFYVYVFGPIIYFYRTKQMIALKKNQVAKRIAQMQPIHDHSMMHNSASI